MPATLSKSLTAKLLGSEWSFGYNCYEVGHTWTPSCTDAALEVSLAAAARVMPLYALLYGFSQVAIQRKLDPANTWDTFKSVVRSSAFIFFHLYNGSILGCALRNSLGRFYYRVLVCIPALTSSYLSLLIERPSRRQALAFYLLNLATEILYRMSVAYGYFKPLAHGETLLFSLSLAAWYYLLKAHGFGHDPVSAVMKLLIGRDEAKSRRRGAEIKSLQAPPPQATDITSCRNGEESHLHQNAEVTCSKKSQSKLANLIDETLDFVGRKWFGDRHASCPHSNLDGCQTTCLNYIIKPIPSRFLIGCAIQTLLKLSSKPLEFIGNPLGTLAEALVSRGSFRFGMFLATLVASGRLMSCLLRHYSDSNEPHWHGAVAGLAAGCSMFWAPRSSISMYVMWKAVEQYFLLAARQGKVRHFNFSILTIYSLSATAILYTFALEPKLMRPSYMKFLDNLSEHRLHQLNRMVLDVFGTGSSIGYEDYFPDLDPKHMSNQFKELIFNWMIQPFE